MGDEVIGFDDFTMLCKELSAAFGEDYIQPDGLAHQKAKQVFQLAIEEGMTKNDFRKTLKEFIKNQVYPNWVPGAFFKNNSSEKLYPEKWMVEQIKKEPSVKQYLEGYEFNIDGKKITMWRWTRSNTLPFKQIYPVKQKPMYIKEMPTPPLTDEMLKEMDVHKELFNATTALITKQEQLEAANNIITVLKSQLEIVNRELEHLNESKNDFNLKNFTQLKENNLSMVETIQHLETLVNKFRAYITKSIEKQSVSEQLTIWKKIMEDK